MSRPYAEVIGDPIAQSKSPAIHNFWLAKLGIDAEYRACHVRPEDLEDYFAQRRRDAEWRGCNVTIPHKVAVVDLIDLADAEVLQIGASNCVVPRDASLAGKNTDDVGILRAIPRAIDAAVLIGCGGAARSAVCVLEFLATIDIRVVARDTTKAAALLKEFGYPPKVAGFDDAAALISGADCILNASPLGMSGHPPMPEQVLAALSHTSDDAFVFDMVYAPLETELLCASKGLGRVCIDGLVMLIEQADASFFHFFGQPAPREHDAELRALLTA